MKFKDVADIIEGVPFTSPERGREIYDFILRHRPKRCLELGVAHGTSTCYVAAALDEIGESGVIDAVDLMDVDRDPQPEELLERCGLDGCVKVHREKTSYTWFLKKAIDEQSRSGICVPRYDFCFIDGPKNWTIDGAAFFMVDKLLNEEGVIVFDDYSYAYGDRERVTDGIHHRALADDERLEPHIEAVFRLLVMQHPSYGNFKVVNEQWAWAQKNGGTNRTLSVVEKMGVWQKALRRLRKFRRSL
jgi:predicted O-methyltransferase YrrM